jgi:hypothetical protein
MRVRCWLPLLVLLAGVLTAASGAAAASCEHRALSGQASACTCQRLAWKYDPRSRTFSQDTKITATDDPDGKKYIYRLIATCSGNTGGTVDLLCRHATSCPVLTAADGQKLRATRWQAMRALKARPGAAQLPLQPFGEPVCVYQGRAVPMAAVVAAVRQRLVKEVGRPRILIQPPGGRVLVNWPVLFSAPAQHRTALAITAPLPGAISAEPSYVWDLGGGQHGVGAGHPYRPSVDPLSAGASGYYVSGIYHRPGPVTATLTLTWDATITLGAGPGALSVQLDPITFTSTATSTAVSATNRLYAQVPTTDPGPG